MTIQNTGSRPFIHEINNFLLNPLNCSDVRWKKCALLILSIFVGIATLGSLHLSFFLFNKLGCIKVKQLSDEQEINSNARSLDYLDENNFKSPLVTFQKYEAATRGEAYTLKIIDSLGEGKFSIIDKEYQYPPKLNKKEITPNDFQSPFSKRVWKSRPECMRCFQKKCNEKCKITWNKAKEELSSMILSYKQLIDSINHQVKETKATLNLKNYLQFRVTEWEDFLHKYAEQSFHSMNNEIDLISSYKEFVKTSNYSKTFFKCLLFSAEAELGIAANFRRYMKRHFQGIRGELKTSREELANQLNECLNYASSKDYYFNKPEGGSDAYGVFVTLSAILLDNDFLRLARHHDYADDFLIKENESDTSEVLEICSIMCNDPSTHSVAVIKLNDKMHMFDNLSDNWSASRQYNNKYNVPQVTIRISKNLYNKLNLDKLDISKWLTPHWESMNCYASANVICFAMIDYIIEKSKGCHIDFVKKKE